MTDWTDPRTWLIGEKVTKAIMDTHVRDNLKHLKEQFLSTLQLISRQGGSPTEWNVQGTTNYTPTSVRTLVGTGRISFSASIFASMQVTYSTPFAHAPIVLVTAKAGSVPPASLSRIYVSNELNSRFFCFAELTASSTGTLDFFWIAIGD